MAFSLSEPRGSGGVSFFYDPRVRNLFYQVAVFAVVIAAFYWIIGNTVANLERANIASGFGFLNGRAGFDISQSLIPYSSDSTYARAFLVGLINTLYVAVLGIIVASIVGFLVGIGRLSHNWLIRKLCTVYVEVFRNIPPLLVIFFWYFGILSQMPSVRQSLSLPLGVYVNTRGVFMPAPVWGEGAWLIPVALLAAVFATVFVARWARKRQMATGKPFHTVRAGVALIVGLQPLITAVIAGYEVGRRVLEACGGYESFNGLGWHSTGVCGAFGAASAVGALHGFDAKRHASALGVACSYAGGTWAFIHDGSQTKKLHAGRAAEGGLSAARLAAAGLDGPLSVFDASGWGNFFATFARGEADENLLSADFGQFWRINRCSIKPYATCRGTHSAVDAVEKMLAGHGFAPSDIARIDVGMSAFQAGMCGGKTIASRADAQMSLPYALAARLEYGKVGLDELERAAWSAPAIARWLALTHVEVDPAMEAEAEPAVTLTLSDGRAFRETVEFPLGSRENPMSDAAVIAKFMALAGRVLPEERCREIRDFVMALDTIPDARRLPVLLSRPAKN